MMNELNFRTLDLNLLRVFDEVMAERNLTRAAHNLAMTQPAVSNALKHGFTQGRGGQITVSVQQHGERTIELSVSNDGHAIPGTLDLEQTTTLGLQLVQLLTRQLNGSLDIQRANPTRFTLRFDLEGEA